MPRLYRNMTAQQKWIMRGQPEPKKNGPAGAGDLIPKNCVVDNATVRDMCSGRKRKPISRDTLLAWRKTRGFPEPFRTLKGPGGPFEVWDRREVRDWLRANGIHSPQGTPRD